MTTMHVKAQKRTKAFQGLRIPLDLEPMEARSVAELPEDTGWQFEPKWDGFRCLAFRAENDVEMTTKSGKSCSRFFPEVLDNLRAVPERATIGYLRKLDDAAERRLHAMVPPGTADMALLLRPL